MLSGARGCEKGGRDPERWEAKFYLCTRWRIPSSAPYTPNCLQGRQRQTAKSFQSNYILYFTKQMAITASAEFLILLNVSTFNVTRVGRLAEGSNASSLEPRHCVRIPSRKKTHFFLRQLARVLFAILKAFAPLGAGVSVIAPLPERLPGLIEGSLRPQSSFEYMCLVVISL